MFCFYFIETGNQEPTRVVDRFYVVLLQRRWAIGYGTHAITREKRFIWTDSVELILIISTWFFCHDILTNSLFIEVMFIGRKRGLTRASSNPTSFLFYPFLTCFIYISICGYRKKYGLIFFFMIQLINIIVFKFLFYFWVIMH